MDPLAQLERMCVPSGDGIHEKVVPLSCDSSAEHPSQDNDAVESAQAEAEPEVLAIFSYPSRDENAWHETDHDRGKTRTNKAARSRSRSRERNRENKTLRRDSVTKESATSAEQHQDVILERAVDIESTYTFTPIERMILHQEALLMRHSAKFLEDMKQQFERD